MEKINKSILVNVIEPFTGVIRKNMRASGYVEDGHEFYMVDEQMENDECEVVDVFRADGTLLTGECRRPRARRTIEQTLHYNKKSGLLRPFGIFSKVSRIFWLSYEGFEYNLEKINRNRCSAI